MKHRDKWAHPDKLTTNTITASGIGQMLPVRAYWHATTSNTGMQHKENNLDVDAHGNCELATMQSEEGEGGIGSTTLLSFLATPETCSSDMATRPFSGLPTATAWTAQSAGLYGLPADSHMETIREETGPPTNGIYLDIL
jgi:hypothetical protein